MKKPAKRPEAPGPQASVAEVARLLGLGVSTVRRMCARQEFRGVQRLETPRGPAWAIPLDPGTGQPVAARSYEPGKPGRPPRWQNPAS